MGEYRIRLWGQSGFLELHVPPETIKVSGGAENRRERVLELGEVLILNTPGLLSVEWEGVLPGAGDDLRRRGNAENWTEPMAAVAFIQAAQAAKKPVRMHTIGFDLGVNTAFGIDRFDYEERGGEPGTLYYSIQLTEWKEYGPRQVTAEGEAALLQLAQNRAGEPQAASAKSVTVKSGDCLWSIARKVYGDGSRYPEIYAANKEQIDKRNKGKMVEKYTIYPGQVFIIP